jgi:hopanoid biosynthesis associated RND transporter like protein HpnN
MEAEQTHQAGNDMPTRSIIRLVELCVQHAWWTIVLALAVAAGAGTYAVRHFAIHTDVRDLISPDLPWAQRAQQYTQQFPQRGILVVLDAPTPEIAEQAAGKLADALAAHPDRFRAVSHPGSGSFFEQNGLLFLPPDAVKRITDGLIRSDALLGTLASDPSLRGTLEALSLVLIGVERGEIKLDDTVRPLTMAANAAQAALAGRPVSFSWRALASGQPLNSRDLRRFLQVEPVLDFTALEPGRAATDAIVQIAADLNLADEYQVRVRQTGFVPIGDDEFGTVKQNAGLNATLSLLAVALILWLALHSLRIMLAAAVSLFVGLAVASAVGLLMVGALNLISVAFFALFVGLGIDFGIQFSVRYRAERHDHPDLRTALHSAATKVGGPLALAAVATAVGFASFWPTAYRGLSELGQMAGVGMIVAFITSITLLPALLAVLKPPGEPRPIGFAALAPLDRFMERHRIPIVVITLLVVVLASPLLLFLPFDFNPMHLRSPKVESVATFLELKGDPQTGANAVEILAHDLAAADATARRISALPQVAQARTLSNLVPSEQDEKLKLIHEAAAAVDESLNPGELEKAPTDQEDIEALSSTANDLSKAAGDEQGPGPEAARRLSQLLSQLAEAEAPVRKRLEAAVVLPLRFSLDQLRSELKAQPVSVATIPPDLVREWMTADGHARVEALPKGDPESAETLRNFVDAVLAVEPDAIGPAVVLVEAGNTVVRAFILSGIFALSAIFILLWITLRRIGDVLLTLVPLLVAGIVTLELCVVFGLPLNFANILALPLLLGVGVAFKIYYIVAWRAGKTRLLQSSLTRAVLFSGMTTATAFGSLWVSSHPGTSSMGKLMALSLLCTMAAAVLFQPVLMGPPRTKKL